MLTVIDQRLKDSVAYQLDWDPEVDASLISVSAQDGVVTLAGYVNTYAAKLFAERAARRVYGVKAVANELEVRLATERIDPDIAKDALDALRNRIDVPLGITVTVRDGHITLAGTVEWIYQKMGAERAVKYFVAFMESSIRSPSSQAFLRKTSRSALRKRCIVMRTSTRGGFTSRPRVRRSS